MPGPKPRQLLRDAAPSAFAEAIDVVGRPDFDLDVLGAGSSLPVRWRCITCAHIWEAKPAARTRGSGCPRCAEATRARSRAQAPAGRSLKDLFPQLATEFERNLERADMGPADLRHAAQQRCLWRCHSCSHKWTATVANRTSGRGCPECGTKRKAEGRRRPTPRSGTAADAASFPLSELVKNLTNPDHGLADVRPSSLDRCRWRCSACAFEWDATVTNRVGKRSGCPKCSDQRNADRRSRAPQGKSLAARFPTIADEFRENLSRPGLRIEELWPGSNAVCRWQCARGHEWLTTVASRVAGAGCARCSGRGQSRLEFEVAELLRISTGLTVLLDVRVQASGRNWRIDLSLPELDLLIDLDPKHWHRDVGRDQRKVDALAGHSYLRVRPMSLPSPGGRICKVPDDDFNPLTWATSLRPALEEVGAKWRTLTDREHATALAAAAARWQDTMRGRPVRSAYDAAPHLEEQFIENLTRPGITPGWLAPNSKDRCRWIGTCGHEWTSSIASRAGRGTDCPTCARARTSSMSRARSFPGPKESLLDKYADVATQFVACLKQPSRRPADLRPSSNLVCRWRCPDCGIEFDASPAARIRGRGCQRCSRVRGGEARSTVIAELSIATTHPDLADELVEIVGRLARRASDVSSGSNLAASWRCATCDQEWVAGVSTRAIAGHGCPTCARRRTATARMAPRPGQSLEDLYPALAREFVENLTHPDRAPSQLKPGSHDRCVWRGDCGHEWINVVKNRVRLGSGCPTCHRLRQ